MIKHIAGKFWSAEIDGVPVFVGTKEKAEAFLTGAHKPEVTPLKA